MRSPGCSHVYLRDLSSFYSPPFTFLPFTKTKLRPSGLLLTAMVLESLWRLLACWVHEPWLLPERSSLAGTSFSCLLACQLQSQWGHQHPQRLLQRGALQCGMRGAPMCVVSRGVRGGGRRGEQQRSVPVVGNRDVPSYLPGFFSLPSSSCLCLKQRRLKDSSVRNTDLFYMTAHKRPSPNSAHTLSVCITSSLHTPVGRLSSPWPFDLCYMDHSPHVASYYPSRQFERNGYFILLHF